MKFITRMHDNIDEAKALIEKESVSTAKKWLTGMPITRMSNMLWTKVQGSIKVMLLSFPLSLNLLIRNMSYN